VAVDRDDDLRSLAGPERADHLSWHLNSGGVAGWYDRGGKRLARGTIH
jgi:hypothetical protein